MWPMQIEAVLAFCLGNNMVIVIAGNVTKTRQGSQRGALPVNRRKRDDTAMDVTQHADLWEYLHSPLVYER